MLVLLGISRVYLGQNFVSYVMFSYALGFGIVCIYLLLDEVVYDHFGKINKVTLLAYSIFSVFIFTATYLISNYLEASLTTTESQNEYVDAICGEGYSDNEGSDGGFV